MSLYPIFLKLEGRKVLIVGGGAVAQQKLEGVLRSATDVTVIASEATDSITRWAAEGRLRHVAAEYRAGMARGYFLVIACTDSEAVNRAVYEEASQAGAIVNAVDDPAYCDFYAPAVVNRGDFQIAISTGGASPALAQRVRRELEQKYGPEYGSWTSWLGRVRSALRETLPRSESRKQLIRMLAMGQPQPISDSHSTKGDNDGRSKAQPVGSNVERGIKAASA
jgi:precorrin-2 dehydrogenase/sirohydrochlorin ferrochelatase